MVFQFLVFVHTLIYLIALELAISIHLSVFFWATIISAITIMSVKRLGNDWSKIIIPFVLSVSSLALVLLIDSSVQRQIFIVLSSGMYYFILLAIYRLKLYEKDQTARGLFSASLAATAFFFFAASYGIYLNFNIPLWFLAGVYLLVTGGMSASYYMVIDKNRPKIVVLYSAVIAIGMAELITVLNFWPFGYLTTGVVALIFYYILWDIGQMYFLGSLSKRRLVAHVIFFGLLIAVILSTSRWTPSS